MNKWRPPYAFKHRWFVSTETHTKAQFFSSSLLRIILQPAYTSMQWTHAVCSALDSSVTSHSLMSFTEDKACSPEYARTYCKMTSGGSSRGDYVTSTGCFQNKLQWQKNIMWAFITHLNINSGHLAQHPAAGPFVTSKMNFRVPRKAQKFLINLKTTAFCHPFLSRDAKYPNFNPFCCFHFL
jgi:hypothetical protein